jgi:chromate reductase, NAD(P)H dehydrogenase (quinone)
MAAIEPTPIWSAIWSVHQGGLPILGSMVRPSRILMFTGSLRSGSTNTALLRTAQAVAPEGMAAGLYEGLGRLPLFNPDDDAVPLHPAVADLRAGIAGADALLFSTPEYAGALPGPLKNLLDWTVGGGETYGKPVAWLNASGSPTGAAEAHRSLRTVLGYTGSDIVEGACAHIPVARSAVGSDGLIVDGTVRKEIRNALGALSSHLGEQAEPLARD